MAHDDKKFEKGMTPAQKKKFWEYFDQCHGPGNIWQSEKDYDHWITIP